VNLHQAANFNVGLDTLAIASAIETSHVTKSRTENCCAVAILASVENSLRYHNIQEQTVLRRPRSIGGNGWSDPVFEYTLIGRPAVNCDMTTNEVGCHPGEA
jgi:hypothetical protein